MNTSNVNMDEIRKFGSHAERWWDTQGDLRTLHAVNPLRLQFIRGQCQLEGARALDVGCGGGILSEALALNGAETTGIDLSAELTDIAELHALDTGVSSVKYRCVSAEILAQEQPEHYDIVTCMEMLEHVPDPAAIVQACAQLVKPDGLVFFSTLNRNFKSWLTAIVGAEYLLNMIPRGTHQYDTFIKPSELTRWSREYGLELIALEGIGYNPLTRQFSLTPDIDINYLAAFRRSR